MPEIPDFCTSLGCRGFRLPGSIYCVLCASENMNQDRQQPRVFQPIPEPETVTGVPGSVQLKPVGLDPRKDSSGGDNDYWVAHVTEPKRLDPYYAECEDLIELFQFSFAEGNAFKALWRMGMDRVAQGKPGDTPLRNAEKVAYYGDRMVIQELRKLDSIEQRFQTQETRGD